MPAREPSARLEVRIVPTKGKDPSHHRERNVLQLGLGELRMEGGAALQRSRLSLTQAVSLWRKKAPSNAVGPTVAEPDARALHAKFAAAGDSFTFQYGSIKEFFDGLEGLVGSPSADLMAALDTLGVEEVRHLEMVTPEVVVSVACGVACGVRVSAFSFVLVILVTHCSRRRMRSPRAALPRDAESVRG